MNTKNREKLLSELLDDRLTKDVLRKMVNYHGLSLVLMMLTDIAEEAHENNPFMEWDRDALAMDSIIPHIEN